MHYGDQTAPIERLGDCEKKEYSLQEDANGARGTPREPLINRNQYIPNVRG